LIFEVEMLALLCNVGGSFVPLMLKHT
jgi:hypothetical protein